MISAGILVTGKVQGVWFRDFVWKSAIKLNLKGWVKNNLDGSVAVEVEGDKSTIEELITKIKIGSPLSKVENVKVNWKEFDNKYQSFKIIR